MTNTSFEPHFYADLNPRYPSKGEKRWRIFFRDKRRNVYFADMPSYVTRKAAERNAAGLNAVASGAYIK